MTQLITEETIFQSLVRFNVLPFSSFDTLKIGSVTPSVANLETWVASNIAPLTITNFLNGASGQKLNVLGDGFTSVANNANIKTGTGISKLLLPNKIYTFHNINNVWYEYNGNILVFNIADFGAVSGVNADLPLTNSTTAAHVSGGIVWIPPGTFPFTIAIPWYNNIAIEGAGKEIAILTTASAINGINAHDAGPGFAHQSGKLKSLTIQNTGAGLIGVDVNFRDQINVEDVRVLGWTREGIYFNNCILPKVISSLIQNCGDATHPQVQVESSTTFIWDHTYISGNLGTTFAGLAIDKTTSFTILGGASESTGIPIRLCGKADNLVGVNAGSIIDIDLENPSNGADCYIEMGAGWTGAAFQGVTKVTIQGVNQSPSGSVSVKYGFKAQNTDSITVLPGHFGVPAPASGGIANVELVGLTNTRWSLLPQVSLLSPGLIYVRENGAARTDAVPFLPWWQEKQNVILKRSPNGSFALNSTTPDASGASFIGTNSAVATTITNVTGGIDGQVLYIYAGDGNTTLKHNNAGVGKFSLVAGVNKLLAVGSITQFIFETNLTGWREVG